MGGGTGIKRLGLGQIVLYSVANMGANLVYTFANLAFPLFLAAYPISNLVIGLLAQERSLVGGLVQPLVGTLSDRMPANRFGRRRPFFLFGVPLTALALVLLSTHPPLWVVVGVMTVFSFFLAVAYDPYLALLPDITPQEQRGRVGGVMALFTMLGGIVVIALSFLLWEAHQDLVFWLVALGMVVTFAITFLTVSEPPMVRAVGRAGARRNVGAYLRDIGGRPELLRYLAVTFFFWLGNGGVTPFVTRFGVAVLGLEENASFLLVLPAILGAALFAVPAGLLSERFGKQRVLAAGLLLFGAVGVVGAQLVQGIADAVLLMSLVGVANAITTALFIPLLADMIPRRRAGEFIGIGSSVQSLAQPIGAMAAGALADATGTLRGAFAAGGVAMLVSFALLLTLHSERAEREAEIAEELVTEGA